MASLLWMPDALRAGGCKVWEDPGWTRRSHGAMSDIRGVVGHHTAGGGSNDWRVVRDGRAGLPGPLAQLTVERDGTWRVLASGQSWHAGTGGPWRDVPASRGNQHFIGVEGVSRGVGSDWTDAQREAYPRGVAALLRYLGMGPDRFLFHKTWAPRRKIDIEGWRGDLEGFRADVARHLHGAPPPAPPKSKGLPDMIERPLAKGPNYLRIACPCGAASSLVDRQWVSVTAQGGIVKGAVAFQRNADTDAAPPGAGPIWHFTALNAHRRWREMPSGTEYIEAWIDTEGPGSLLIESQPR